MPNILGQNFIAGGRSALGQSLQKPGCHHG